MIVHLHKGRVAVRLLVRRRRCRSLPGEENGDAALLQRHHGHLVRLVLAEDDGFAPGDVESGATHLAHPDLPAADPARALLGVISVGHGDAVAGESRHQWLERLGAPRTEALGWGPFDGTRRDGPYHDPANVL